MKNNKIDAGREFDWGRVSKDYAKYRDIYPDEFYNKIACRGVGASLTPSETAAWEQEHMQLLSKIAPERFDILHSAAIAVLKIRQ